jgi:methyl-accepting chemotaxis protein
LLTCLDNKDKEMKLNNLKIGQRLGLGFGLIIALLVLITGTALANMGALNDMMSKVVKENNVRLDAATDMRDAQRRVSVGIRDIILASDESEIEQVARTVDATWQDYDRAESLLTKLTKLPDAQALLGKIVSARQAALPLIAHARALGKENNDQEAIAYVKTQVVPAVGKWQDAIGELMDLMAARNKADQAEGDQKYEHARLLMHGVATVSALLAIAIGWLITRSITRPMRVAVDIAKTVAAGDLTSRIDVDSNDETGELLAALKEMNGALLAIVGQVRSGAETMATATNEIASGNLDLSSRTEQQAGALEETASSMEELTATVKQNADNARQANQLALSASEVATRGGAVVGDVVATMGSINESANKIVDIIGVIDGIAFQTNILALNAAVEAARAGEQGRGFAVVASEVRNLAQRSAGAAKEIKALIGDSVEKVGEGSRLVNQAGATMEEIVTSVRRVTDIMAEITSASQEQEAGIEQINQAIGEMDSVTQQNAALVEEAAAAAQSLQVQSSQLEQVVSAFRLSGVAEKPARAAAVAAPRQVAKAAQPRLAAAGGEWETF